MKDGFCLCVFLAALCESNWRIMFYYEKEQKGRDY